MILISNIDWDVTDSAEEMTQEEINDTLASLPTIVVIDKKDLAKYDIDEDCSDLIEITDVIGDYLSDTYGFCYYSFEVIDDFSPTIIPLVEVSDHKEIYGYLKLENVIQQDVQSKINEIKNDANFLAENPDWGITDVFKQFPDEWIWEFASNNNTCIEI